VVTIGDDAFSYCSGLTSVDIPNSVTTIGESAFSYCSGLTSVTNLSPTPQGIPGDVFDGVELSKATLCVPSGSVGAYRAASVWKNFGRIEAIGGGGGASGTTGDCWWTITGEADNYTLTISGSGAMADYGPKDEVPWSSFVDGLKTLVIEEGVSAIGDYAFHACMGLTSAVIPNSVRTIGSSAFDNCRGLTSVVIPNSVATVGSYAFYYCTDLTSLVIGSSVETIGNVAFSNCTRLSSVTNLRTTPQNITNNNVFSGVDLREVVLSVPAGSVEAYLSASVWKDFGTIEAIGGGDGGVVASGITGDCKWTLTGTTGNYTLTISGTGAMADYDPGAGYGVPWYSYREEIKTLVIEQGVSVIGNYAFSGCDGLPSVVIPNSVVTIGDWAFYESNSLPSVVIPNSVASIGYGAFSYCSGLTSVVIGSSVATIGTWAFGYCTALTSVTNLSPTPQTFTDGSVFEGVDVSKATLYVPVGSVGAYRAAPVWQDFGSIEGIVSSGLDDWQVADVAVFPNPFTDAVRITGAAGSRLTVFGTDGAQVHKQSVAGADEWLSLGHLPAGGYLLRVEKDGVVKVVKVLKR
jgi:hypothetical protein